MLFRLGRPRQAPKPIQCPFLFADDSYTFAVCPSCTSSSRPSVWQTSDGGDGPLRNSSRSDTTESCGHCWPRGCSSKFSTWYILWPPPIPLAAYIPGFPCHLSLPSTFGI